MDDGIEMQGFCMDEANVNMHYCNSNTLFLLYGFAKSLSDHIFVSTCWF